MEKSKVQEFLEALNKHRKQPEHMDEYDDRTTHCHLYCNHTDFKDKRPIFEVRGWSYDSDKDRINVSIVNWTVMAGTGSCHIDFESIKWWSILEDNPTLQVLHGR